MLLLLTSSCILVPARPEKSLEKNHKKTPKRRGGGETYGCDPARWTGLVAERAQETDAAASDEEVR
jgi:hypothetical protein